MVATKTLDLIKSDIVKNNPSPNDFGQYRCGCMIYGLINGLCKNHHQMMPNH